MASRIRCVLFDIDGTLVWMQGAGTRAMGRAFESLTGIADAFRDLPMAGRTDRAIVAGAIERLTASGVAVPDDAGFLAAFEARYLGELEREALWPGPRALPGVIATLERLERAGIVVGLATGNFEGAARIKLSRFGLWSRFGFGGWGDGTCDRTEVVDGAAREGRRRSGAAAGEVVVVGDTPADVAAARAVGARSLAVATGPFSAAELAPCGGETVVETLLEALARGYWG